MQSGPASHEDTSKVGNTLVEDVAQVSAKACDSNDADLQSVTSGSDDSSTASDSGVDILNTSGSDGTDIASLAASQPASHAVWLPELCFAALVITAGAYHWWMLRPSSKRRVDKESG